MKKVIFVDFDNTICLHRKPIEYGDPKVLFMDSEKACDCWFQNSVACKELITKLYEMKQKGAELFLLTDSGSRQLESKKIWIKKNCDGLFTDCFATSVDAPKWAFIKSYMEYKGLAFEECMLIDDHPDTYNRVMRENICEAYPPQLMIVWDQSLS